MRSPCQAVCRVREEGTKVRFGRRGPLDDACPMRLIRSVLIVTLTTALVSGCAASHHRLRRQRPGRNTDAGGGRLTAAGQALLGKHGPDGKSAVEVIDSLDRMPVRTADRPSAPRLRPDVLLVSGDDAEVRLPIPADRFYLSVAPYIDTTHECFNHSLTTCKGELGGKDVDVSLVEEGSGKVSRGRGAPRSSTTGSSASGCRRTRQPPCGSPTRGKSPRRESPPTTTRRPVSRRCSWPEAPRRSACPHLVAATAARRGSP